MARYHDGDNVGWVHLPPSLHVLSTHIILHSPFTRVDGPWDTLRLVSTR